MHDVVTIEQYKENLLGVRIALPKILALFEQYEIHATWAIVGLLYFKEKEELLRRLPKEQPTYTNQNFSPYCKLAQVGVSENEDLYHFGSSLIDKIDKTPHQEIATHTFSHYYCLEDGQTVAQFKADVEAAIQVADQREHKIRSMVFPRNQVKEDYLAICKDLGIRAYRGNENHYAYKESKFHEQSLFQKVLRALDSYMNLLGHHTYPLRNAHSSPILNLKSSRFLRPYSSKLKWLEPLKRMRIKKSLRQASMNGEIYHLWWHPHNFGKDIKKNLACLEDILIEVAKLQKEYGLQSLTMEEATQQFYERSNQ